MERFNQSFSIGDRKVGKNYPVYIIAEAGVAHFGNIDKAYRLVDLAAEAGVDAVKFQIFDINALISESSAEWRTRLGSRCLPYDDFRKIQSYCNERNITFFATAHDEPSLTYLDGLNVPAYKIGSGELENWPYLAKIAERGKPVIFSTGMFSMNQVETALNVMAATGNRDIAVLHCVTSYPSNPADVNLFAIEALHDKFNTITGYSDHTQGIHFPIAAVARGACIIEKHISLDFNIPDAQDWKVSCGPKDLHLLVQQIREIEIGLGIRDKKPSENELKNLAWARKSLVAKVNIKANETITAEKLTSKRPGTGIPPSEIDSVIGKRVTTNIAKDTVLYWEHLSE